MPIYLIYLVDAKIVCLNESTICTYLPNLRYGDHTFKYAYLQSPPLSSPAELMLLEPHSKLVRIQQDIH